MATVFDTLFASTGLPVLFRNFGEPVVYLVHGGLQVPLVAIISPDEDSEPETNHERLRLERIKVRIGVSDAQVVAGQNVGGIPFPKELDRLVRTYDVTQRPYVYVEPISMNENTQLLRFQRDRVERIGTGNQQR